MGKQYSLFILNRDLVKPHDVEIIWREASPERVLFSQVLTGADLKACNSFDDPKKVAPQPFAAAKKRNEDCNPGSCPLLYRYPISVKMNAFHAPNVPFSNYLFPAGRNCQ